MRGVERGGLGEHGVILTRRAQGAGAADELHAQALLDFLHLAELDVADLAGGIDVRAAAGTEVDAANLNQTQRWRIQPSGSLRTPAVTACSGVT